ncbi:MAG: Polyphenol oxidase [Chlamydiia bacterium]|nr:Polyphenol oxidase [Chlamydiia bacterium]
MEVSEDKEIQVMHYERLMDREGVIHAVFSRHGGVSEGEFASLNCSYSVGDDPRRVAENRMRMASYFGCREFVIPRLVHGDVVEVVEKGDSKRVIVADGVITDVEGICLGVSFADCQTALFYDPIRHVVGSVHAGWRGLVQNIYARTLERMFEAFGCLAQDVIVGISPSLGPGQSEFIHYKREFSREHWGYVDQENRIDMWKLATDQLVGCGVMRENIEVAGVCTYLNGKDYFSYRRDRVCGRNMSAIMLAFPS